MLSKGTDLAKKMKELGEMKWKVMSAVWVEMLSYAAVHIKGEVHVQVCRCLTKVESFLLSFGC